MFSDLPLRSLAGHFLVVILYITNWFARNIKQVQRDAERLYEFRENKHGLTQKCCFALGKGNERELDDLGTFELERSANVGWRLPGLVEVPPAAQEETGGNLGAVAIEHGALAGVDFE